MPAPPIGYDGGQMRSGIRQRSGKRSRMRTVNSFIGSPIERLEICVSCADAANMSMI